MAWVTVIFAGSQGRGGEGEAAPKQPENQRVGGPQCRPPRPGRASLPGPRRYRTSASLTSVMEAVCNGQHGSTLAGGEGGSSPGRPGLQHHLQEPGGRPSAGSCPTEEPPSLGTRWSWYPPFSLVLRAGEGRGKLGRVSPGRPGLQHHLQALYPGSLVRGGHRGPLPGASGAPGGPRGSAGVPGPAPPCPPRRPGSGDTSPVPGRPP